MDRRRSQREINNDLINSEMKMRFSYSTSNLPVSNVSSMHTNSVVQNMVSETMNENDNIPDQNNNNNKKALSSINFNQAIFNKNFIPMQTIHNDSVETDSTLYSTNMPSEIYLSDDLSLLPVIDEKTLFSTLKSKFEMRKYFVNKILNFKFSLVI